MSELHTYPKNYGLTQAELSLEKIFDESKPQLLRTISSRIGLELGQRVSPSDVLQEAFIAASRKLQSQAELPDVPMFTWIQGVCFQVISIFYRRHFSTSKRSIARERSNSDDYVSIDLQIDSATSPSGCMIRAEERRQVLAMINKLSENDREILALRHLSSLSNEEAADKLQISAEAAKKRHTRAIMRLSALAEMEVNPFDLD